MRERIEAGFEGLGRWVARHRAVSIALCLVFAAGWASQLPKVGVETAVETFLPKDAPGRIRYDTFREQFGREELIIIAIQPPEVFDLGFLRKLQRFHDEIESEVPYVDDVQSLINARATYGREDELVVEDLLETFPETPEELAGLRERVMSNPLYLDTVISEDARFTTVVVELQLFSSAGDVGDALGGFDDATASEPQGPPPYLSGAEQGEAVHKIEQIMERYRSDDFKLWVAGSPPLAQAVVTTMMKDLQRFMALMLLTIAVVLFAMFRRLSGVLLPLLVVVLSLVSTIGMLAASGAKLSPPSQILPTFLLAVGTGAAVHILKLFFLRFDAGDSAEDAIGRALRHSGLPVAMTSLTTAGGLLSFLAAGLTPIVTLGIFAPIGILIALTFCLVLLPALLATLPLRRKGLLGGKPAEGPLDRAIVRMGDYSVRHAHSMVAVTIVVVLVSSTGIARLRFSNDVMSWLLPEDPFRQATDIIDHELKGSITLEVIADTGRENGVKEPAFLNGLELLRERVGDVKRGDYLFVGKTIALSDVLKEIHQALNENRSDFYAIPQDPALVSQELLLFENTGTDDLEDFVDTQFQLARFTLKVPYADPMLYEDFISQITDEFAAVFPEGVDISATGFMGMMSETVRRVIFGLARSYVLALAIITPLMILLIGNLRGGLVSMIPNLTPIMLTLGVMGWADVPIDMFTMMIGGIAIGLAVDDTIHFIHGFRRELVRTGNAREAVRETLETTGRALLVTSVVLASGFLIFGFSQMRNLKFFGVFTSFTIAMAFLIDMLITPALMTLVSRSRVPAEEPVAALP